MIISGGGSGIGKALISVLYVERVKEFAVIGRDISKLNALESEYSNAEFLTLKGISQYQKIYTIFQNWFQINRKV